MLHFLDHGVNRLHCERLTAPKFAFIMPLWQARNRSIVFGGWRFSVEKRG